MEKIIDNAIENTIIPMRENFASQFSEKGAILYLNEVVKGNHSEAAWEKEVPTFMEFLCKDWK